MEHGNIKFTSKQLIRLQNINAEINKKINSQLKIYFSTR